LAKYFDKINNFSGSSEGKVLADIEIIDSGELPAVVSHE